VQPQRRALHRDGKRHALVVCRRAQHFGGLLHALVATLKVTRAHRVHFVVVFHLQGRDLEHAPRLLVGGGLVQRVRNGVAQRLQRVVEGGGLFPYACQGFFQRQSDAFHHRVE